MGIQTDWVNKILRENFDAQHCWLDRPPFLVGDRVFVIDDFSVAMYSLMSKAETGLAIAERTSTRIRSYVQPTSCLTEYITLFVAPENVPKSKGPTQQKRTADLAKRGVHPWTRSEIDSMKISIGDGPLPDVKRIPITRDVKLDLFRYLTETILVLDLHQFKSGIPDVVIDGGRQIDHRARYNPDTQVHPISAGKSFIYRYSPGKGVAREIAPSKMGEGDLKIVTHITRIVKRELQRLSQPRHPSEASEPSPPQPPIIMVRTTDTDTVPILLLAMQDWIVKPSQGEPGRIPVRIYLDLARSVHDGVRIIDMVELWRRIMVFFHRHMPSVRHPIVTLSTLMVATGSDYVDNFPGMGPTTMWNYFHSLRGFEVLYPSPQVPFVRDLQEKTVGMFDGTRDVALAECSYEKFILTMYEEAQYSGMRCAEVLRPIISGGRSAPSQMAIRAQIRRIHWNVHYWCNGGKGHVIDPLARHPHTNLPLHGWAGFVSRTTNEFCVTQAERVHED